MQIFGGSEMLVLGSEFRTHGSSTSTSKEKSAMAGYMVQRPAPYDSAYWFQRTLLFSNFFFAIKIPTHMCKQLKINCNLFSHLVRNFKFTNFHSSALVGVLKCNYLLSISFHFLGASDLQYVLFLLLRVFF